MDFRKVYNESNLKEDISESRIETLSDSLKKISEWIGSIWELKELPKGAWRTDKPRYKIRGFEVYPKGIYVKFSFENKDDDGHVYENSLEDWLEKNYFIEG